MHDPSSQVAAALKLHALGSVQPTTAVPPTQYAQFRSDAADMAQILSQETSQQNESPAQTEAAQGPVRSE